MKIVSILSIFLTVVGCSKSFAKAVPQDSSVIVEKIVESAWADLEAAPNLYPHFFVYGLEVEASAGISDLVEVGSSLGIELHFERREK